MPNIQRKASHNGIVGGSGTGKTEFAKRFFTCSRHDRVFIFDHMGEYASRLGSLAVECGNFDDMLALAEENRIVIFDPAISYGGEFEMILPYWCDQVFEIARAIEPQGRETLAVIDEVQKLVTTGTTPREVKNLLQTGRKFALDTCFVSQQPNRMPNEMREQWTELVCFRLKDSASLESLDNFGFSDEELAEIASLPDLHYLWRHLQRGETVRGVIGFHR